MTPEWSGIPKKESLDMIYWFLLRSRMSINSLLESRVSLPEELRSILIEIGNKQQEALRWIGSNPQHTDT